MEIAKGTNQRNEMEATASDESQKYRDQIKVSNSSSSQFWISFLLLYNLHNYVSREN